MTGDWCKKREALTRSGRNPPVDFPFPGSPPCSSSLCLPRHRGRKGPPTPRYQGERCSCCAVVCMTQWWAYSSGVGVLGRNPMLCNPSCPPGRDQLETTSCCETDRPVEVGPIMSRATGCHRRGPFCGWCFTRCSTVRMWCHNVKLHIFFNRHQHEEILDFNY